MVNDRNLTIQGYNLIQADHPDNVKRGGVCLYLKENLTSKVIDNSFIAQYIVCEIALQKDYVVVTCQSPSQSITVFDEFWSNFDKLLNNIKQFRPSFTIILGNFNARSKLWWPEDVTSYEGTQIEPLKTMHGLQQLISDPAHLLPNPSSCIELIFTDQPNLAVNSGVHLSLHVKCHHQIIYCKFNLMIVYGWFWRKKLKQGYQNFFFQLSVFSQPVFLLENPTHWGLEIAACPNFAKPASDIFAVCSLVPSMNLSHTQQSYLCPKNQNHLLKKSDLRFFLNHGFRITIKITILSPFYVRQLFKLL